jgi:hypothetical protein
MSAEFPPPRPQFFSTSDQDWPAHDTAGHSWIQGTPAVMLAPWRQQIRWQARECLTKGQYQLAVLLSQVACELHTGVALETLMAPYGDPRLSAAVIRLLRSSVTLDHGQVRELWAEWTGERPAGHSQLKIDPVNWWAEWKTARDLRDDVAHKGERVSEAQGTAAFEAAEKYIEYLGAVVSRGAIPAGQSAAAPGAQP